MMQAVQGRNIFGNLEAMMKTYLGQVPNLAEGWQLIEKYQDDEGVTWLVFRKAQEHTPDWSTYKVAAEGRAPNKANYWLVRNDKTGQIGLAKDFALMRKTRPQLHAQIERVFKRLS